MEIPEPNNSGTTSIGIVVPLFNEEGSLEKLHEAISSVCKEIEGLEWKVCYVDDGSTDRSWKIVENLCSSDPEHASAIRLRRNFGKAEALQAGFSCLETDVIFTMDADLQDDPKEIPAFLKKLDEGYDMVSGWKQVRHDPLDKTLPSRVFNALARAASGVKLNDFNCGFKAYRREVTAHIQLFGEMHRFIPILAHAEGFRVGELPVEHHPRKHGVSKYGSKRFVKGLLDLMTVVTVSRYFRRPAHVFGGTGLATGSIGFGILLFMTIDKFLFSTTMSDRPLFFLGILLLLFGTQLLSLGLLAELIIRQNIGAVTEKNAVREKRLIDTL